MLQVEVINDTFSNNYKHYYTLHNNLTEYYALQQNFKKRNLSIDTTGNL